MKCSSYLLQSRYEKKDFGLLYQHSRNIGFNMRAINITIDYMFSFSLYSSIVIRTTTKNKEQEDW